MNMLTRRIAASLKKDFLLESCMKTVVSTPLKPLFFRRPGWCILAKRKVNIAAMMIA